MNRKYIRFLLIAVAVFSLSGCGGDNSSKDSEESSGGSYISCVLEYNDAVRAGVVNATQAEINEECRSQYAQ
jgi:uncharacterized protein YceK